METIIKKAIEGGYETKSIIVGAKSNDGFIDEEVKFPQLKEQIVCDPLFWQALGKSCGWGVKIGESTGDVHVNHEHNNGECTDMCVVPSVINALNFHRINLTQGWSEAVEYLKELTTHV